MKRKGKPAKKARKVKPVPRGTRQPSPHTVPNNIKTWRTRKGLTQQELADIIGVTRCSISNWEDGIKSPRDKYKLALCKEFNCSMQDLFMWGV